MSILAPMVRKVDRDDEAEPDRVLAGFRVVSVFDVSQTDGEPIPEPPCHVLTGDGPGGLEAAIVAYAGAEGLTVETGRIGGGANGEIDRDGRTILVGDHLGPAARCKTLAHELGQWHGLETGVVTDRAGAEIVAKAVALVAGQAPGLDSCDYSPGYALTWAAGKVDLLAVARNALPRENAYARPRVEGHIGPVSSRSRRGGRGRARDEPDTERLHFFKQRSRQARVLD